MIVAAWLAGVGRADELGKVTPFTLVDAAGKPFASEELRGKVWVAHCFYVACSQGCEKTIARMREIQERFRGKRDVALVSISLNPDDREHLKAFAGDLGADPEQWRFLTGPEAETHRVVRKSLFLGVEVDPALPLDKRIAHGYRLLVVNRAGTIVGSVDGTGPGATDAIVARVREVAAERYRLPRVNAALNGAAALLLVVGYLAIRARRERLHKTCMLAALTASAVFLGSYLYFHFAVLDGRPTRFAGPDAVRPWYLALLLTHTILAMAVAPLAIYVTWQGLADRRPRHVRVARWTFPIWLYVSVTGVAVYWILYQLYPPY